MSRPAGSLPHGEMSERLTSDERLRRRSDYQRCYRNGRRRHGKFATLFVAPSSHGSPRLGITATRKVGPAVVRNRLKRRVREIYRRWNRRFDLPAVDLVVHLKPVAAEAGFGELEKDLWSLWQPLIRS